MTACLSQDQLERFCKGQLTGADFASASEHLKDCANCRAMVGSLSNGETVVLDKAANEGPWTGAVPPELADHPRYRILELLSVGGMGAVYKGMHRFLERMVVLKVIRSDLLHDPTHVLRFEREAKLAAQLSHQNVVTVYEADSVGSTLFLVMEFLEGEDLGRIVAKRGPLPVGEACGWVQQAAEGLQYIHERGMVHRDIKPSNLFLTKEGRIKILDLGLANLRTGARSESKQLTLPDQIFGTVGYCSPEQLAQSSSVDIRADIYSLGCTLYYVLAGQPPFASSGSLVEHIMAHRELPVPPIRELRPDVPEELTVVLNRMLAKQPGDRFESPADIAAALEPFTDPSPSSSGARARPVVLVSQTASVLKQQKRRRIIGAAALAAVILVAAVLYWSFGRGRSQSGLIAGAPVIPVGILHSRTGTMALSERGVIDATLFALEELNESGGLLGRRIQPTIEDGQSDPAIFARRAEKLIADDRVAAIFGCWTSASRKSVKEVVEKHGSLLLYPVQNEGLEESPNILYLGAAPNQQIIPAVKWCVFSLQKKRIFLVGSDYIFPRAANAIIRDTAKSLGVEIVGEEYLPLGSSNTEAIAAKVRSSGADIILNTINGDTNIAFFRSLRALGIQSSAIPTMSFSISEEGLASLGPQEIAGDYAAWNYFQNLSGRENTDFVARFRERFGPQRLISDPMEAAYAGVRLWGKAVQAAGTADVATVRTEILRQSFVAPEGPVQIDPESGRISKFIRIGRMSESGTFDIVYSSDAPIKPIAYPETRSRAQWEAFLADLHRGWGGQWASPRRQGP